MMRPRRAPGVPALVVLLAVAGTATCARHTNVPLERATAAGTLTMAGPSIYDLDMPLVESDGHTLALSDLRGRTIVAAMIYTSCTSVCPRIAEDMKAIEQQIPEAERDRVNFAMFSLDPERDTPSVLRRFAEEHRLDRPRWRLFAASADDARVLAAALGLKYAREASGELAHSATIFVIDAAGVVRHRQLGLSAGPADAVRAVVAAAVAVRPAAVP